MADKKISPQYQNKSISIGGDVKDSAVIIGDNNTVNQTFFQKVINIFKSDSETLEHRNRRILLGHVENAWIKGVLDASLHGAALLDLGIKQDPEAVTQYPWAIKKESTDETLPAGTSMLEIFDSIGMGRSLLILGAPGSGKTTMLLELARQLIARAREDATQPIPMVFNLASWTEKLSLADWLAQELNNLYSVPRKTAPDWVKGNKLLLLLDGLDEVHQESRAKCVEAINAFRKEHGLTSLAVCSRSQDYADINAKLSFEGAIEVQPLTQEQITEFFNRFGDETAGIKQALEKDASLREMAETPLFLSIMIMAYRGKQDLDILISQDEKLQRKHLFDNYVVRMFEHPRLKNIGLQKQDILHWLLWLADKMTTHNQVPYLLETMQPQWLGKNIQRSYILMLGLIGILSAELAIGLIGGWLFIRGEIILSKLVGGLVTALFLGLVGGCSVGLREIELGDTLAWDWTQARKGLIFGSGGILFDGMIFGLILGLVTGGIAIFSGGTLTSLVFMVITGGLFGGMIGGLRKGLKAKITNLLRNPGERISLSIENSLFMFLLIWLGGGLVATLYVSSFEILNVGFSSIFSIENLADGLSAGLIFGVFVGLSYGGFALIQHYSLRFILASHNLLPWRLVPFLDHCVDLIFLRRVGGGYIFVHRLLMEHFAEMYVETPTSKGN